MIGVQKRVLFIAALLIYRALPQAAALPNLTPHQPDGWSDKIVVSRITGTRTDDFPLTTADTLYVDIAFINNGTVSTTSRVYAELFIDGISAKTWSWDPLAANWYGYTTDDSIGSLTAGTHMLKLRVDSTGAVSESNENDNEYIKTIVVFAPQIITGQLSDTDADSHARTGTKADFYTLTGTGPATLTLRSTAFNAHLYLYDQNKQLIASNDDGDGNRNSRITYGLANGRTYYVEATSYYQGARGEYTLAASAGTMVPAANPWPPGQVNLIPYRPDGWSDKIVLAKRGGTTTDESGFTTADTVYVDWAVINNGISPINVTFNIGLYVDGQLKMEWYSSPPTDPNGYRYVNDYSIGALSAGLHTITIRADSQGNVAESNEVDNEYTRTITVSQFTPVKAAITSPSPGSTLNSSTVTFSWTAGSNVEQYYLYVGTSVGDNNIYGGSAALNRLATVTGLPADGSTVHVRLWSRFGSNWQYNDYTYATLNTQIKAVLTDPTPGSTLNSSSATFSWSSGVKVEQYYLYVGSAKGGNDIFSKNMGLSRSVVVTSLPANGSVLYVRLWSRFGNLWQFNDYTFATLNTQSRAVLTDPAPSSTLDSSTITFSWSSGSGVVQYYLYVGTFGGGNDIYSRSLALNRSATVTGLPTDGSTVYVRLWSRFGSGWQYNDYTYTSQKRDARILLLLHGMNSNPNDAWNKFIANRFKDSKAIIFGGDSTDPKPKPDASGVYCYCVEFGAFDGEGKTGLEKLTAKTAIGDTSGDFSSFEQLGTEIRDAVRYIASHHNDPEIVLCAHSRGGIAARAFLQNKQFQTEINRVKAILTIGTPHLGSKLGRIYSYLKANPREGATGDVKNDWEVVDLIRNADIPIDVRRPVINDIADDSDELDNLKSNVTRLSNKMKYAQLLFTGNEIGYLAPDAKLWFDYSIFHGILGAAKISEAAKKWMLDDQEPSEFQGDGIVTEESQKLQNVPDAPRLDVKDKFGKSRTYHIKETAEEPDIFLQLKTVVDWWNK